MCHIDVSESWVRREEFVQAQQFRVFSSVVVQFGPRVSIKNTKLNTWWLSNFIFPARHLTIGQSSVTRQGNNFLEWQQLIWYAGDLNNELLKLHRCNIWNGDLWSLKYHFLMSNSCSGAQLAAHEGCLFSGRRFAADIFPSPVYARLTFKRKLSHSRARASSVSHFWLQKWAWFVCLCVQNNKCRGMLALHLLSRAVSNWSTPAGGGSVPTWPTSFLRAHGECEME